jgi:hypothetical protein
MLKSAPGRLRVFSRLILLKLISLLMDLHKQLSKVHSPSLLVHSDVSFLLLIMLATWVFSLALNFLCPMTLASIIISCIFNVRDLIRTGPILDQTNAHNIAIALNHSNSYF